MGDFLKSSFFELFLVLIFSCSAFGELTPPYFNLAEGRIISATATCGVHTDGPELYCKLVGANTENDIQYYRLIQGQVCDYCDPTKPDRAHPPENAIDGKEDWWQSPPLSRGMKYNEVNLTIDFGQEFHVAYIFMRMGNSPRPGLWTLEKSVDYGKTWVTWQHFSDSHSDCETVFGKDSLKPITADDDVICTTEYSKIVPLENGEIPIMLLNNRPSANNYFNSTVLQEWTRATNVRFRFLRTKNLLGHLMSVQRQDPTVTRRYFYSIKDISIGGRCMCNGHADTCHVLEPSPTRILACQCRHNTCGIQCAECCPGFEQKKWRQNTNARPFHCEPCNCFGHSNTCIYDESTDEQGLSLDINGNYEGGGVCQNCQHNTQGINCNQCKPKFYRPYGKHWNETDVCRPCECDNFYSTGNCEEESGRCECRPEYQAPHCRSCSYGHFGYPHCRACECNLNGTNGYYCESENGKCPCKVNFGGDLCKVCADGYYGFPDCTACQCNGIGSINDVCDFESGQCICNSNFDGKQCDRCKDGYYKYPDCLYCNCDIQGTMKEVCGKLTGQCLCKEGYGGPRCDQCLPGYYNYPDCIPCNCSTLGSVSTICDISGKCPCLPSFAGKQCTQCSTGYYAFPECLPCNCDSHGSVGISCNNDGQCLCSNNFDGKTCNQCKEGFYNFPACEECNCDPAGVIARFAGCGSVPAGELCQCKERVRGRICDQCKPLFWNLNISNPAGCEQCDCFIDGTVGALDTCDSKTGQCSCKPSVFGRSCNECKDGTFDLFGESLFGCKDCGCDIGGSINPVCNKGTGQCKCHPRIAGRTCSSPLTTHYFPTLYQNQFEFEDGYTPSGTQVRYQFDENQFPNFSKRGYAKFSNIQSEVINEVTIFKSSVYRMVIRYVNPSEENIVAQILITSDNPNEVDQKAEVLFKSTNEPQFVTVSGPKGEIPSPIVLDPGRYTISVKTNKYLFLDYFVLLPAAYYEASILTKKIENPCELGNLGLCRHYKYPSIIEYKPAYEPFITENNKALKPQQYYEDEEHLSLINEKALPALRRDQLRLNYIVDVPRTGRYIVVIDYVTDRSLPETYIIRVNLDGDEDQDGVVTLYPCTFTTVCRQPVIDADSREKLFFMDTTDLRPIEVLGDDEQINVAIKSIAIIPVEDWSIDFIAPFPVCVMQNGKCVETTFRAAPDSKKIEVEHDHDDKIADLNPDDIYDNSTKLVYLDINQSTLQIDSKVSSPGHYHILVKFYQPNHPQFDIPYKITTDKAMYDGKLTVKNCPSNSGCRALLKQDNGYAWFDIDDQVSITLTNNLPKGIWLDYVLLVPTEQFYENLLKEDTFDQTKEFIKNCGQDHFHIQLNASDFCKQAVFSLTSDYNNGALSCNCDYAGSQSFECDPFGGQCQCKPNVIGRQCEACRTGYYGFPDCKPCDCPSTALCEKDTGECICPLRVTGEKCDKCEDYTFGFDQIIGCESCNCHPMGVNNGNLQCDLNNGTCSCRNNIEGRTCDKCQYGYYNFPHCQQCRCTTEGTTFEICDQQDESCFCKKNVRGIACDTCIDGTYNLQASNPDGCTKCFCFGKTTRCDRAFLRTFNVSMLKDASINTIVITPVGPHVSRWPLMPQDIFVNETMLEVDLSEKDSEEELIYFGVLDYLLDQNNHITSYGGYLTYVLYYTTGLFGKSVFGADVILEGKDIVIVHQSYEQPATAQNFYGSVKMIESSFQTTSGAPVTREQFMMVLRDLNAIYVRATYWDQTVIARLSDVYLTMADEDEENYNLYEELPVEKCQCPPGYSGNSCEDCAPGYYRDPSGPYGGYCIPCQCNGHADTCDCNTGICHECKHYTTGDHCENCIVGYHGNATYGSPHDCMICACPMPIASNNFATSCEISEDGYKIFCTCKEGYTDGRCQSCAAGYYGRPEKEGDTCKPCECSGNIDKHEKDACDSVTGECLRCKNNTYGAACNLCAPGFYGDAIRLKDCQSCVCDVLGTEFCDSFIGTCSCHDNVVGDKCDRCVENHYGFDSGHGCRPCDCSVASMSKQCEDHTGECRCKPGVTGRQCDRCLPGYWNYTSEGCIPCSCNTDYSRGLGCNALTGQCECLPGVVGEKCDACPYRWVLIPDTGCRECDLCHHGLLDVTDMMQAELDPVMDDFKSVASGYFTAQKLNYFNDLVQNLEPDVKALDPNGVNLTPMRYEIESLEMDAKNMDRRILYSDQRAKDLAKGGNRMLNESNDVMDMSRYAINKVRNTIVEIQKLADSFDPTESTKIDNALTEAESILGEMKDYNVDSGLTSGLLETTNDFLKNIERFSKPVNVQNEKLEALRDEIGVFSDKLEDLYIWSLAANRKSNEALMLHNRNKNASVNAIFDTVSNHSKDTQNHIDATHLHSKKCDITMGEVFRHLGTLENVNNELKEITEQVDKELPMQEDEYRNLYDIQEQATENQNKLVAAAKSINLEISNVTANSEIPLKAATAYSDIVDAVNSARNLIKEAKLAAGNATELCDGIEDKAGSSDQIARDMLEQARKSLNMVQADLKPHLTNSTETVNGIIETNKNSDDQTTAINQALDQISIASQTETWQNSRDKAIDAQEKAGEALTILKPIVDQLSDKLVNAKQLPKDIDDANNDIAQAKSQVERVINLLPNVENLVKDLGTKQDDIGKFQSDLGDRFDRLRDKIEMARDIANAIKVGVQFHPNTTLELQPPSNLPLLATNSRISNYFKTDKPNGFLFYLGNENKTGSRKSKRDDFMAMEIENGYPMLTIDLGDGPEKIISNKYVSNGQWHQAIVERTGNNVKLIVREERPDGREQLHEVEETLPGADSMFNVDPKYSKLFVGGYPPEFNVQNGIKYSSFEGQIEDFRIGDQEVGLWNFVDGQDNNNGALERDKLVASEAPKTGYRFSGNGYVILDSKSYTFKQTSTIQFKFKASPDVMDGLIFYAGKHRHFISVEMRNGGIFFQYKLGQHMVTIGSDEMFNDDQWHKVDAERQGRSGILKVDNRLIYQEETAEGNESNLKISDTMYFGGYPGKLNHTEIVQKNFDGCIDEVYISRTPVDLSRNLKAYGVRPGCPMKFSTVLSYPPRQFGYLRRSNVSSANHFQINLKFKTKQDKGLIFYTTNNDQSAMIGLSIHDGSLVLESMKQSLNTGLNKYNDGEWHVVSATHDAKKLRLNVDEVAQFVSDFDTTPLNIEYGDIYFGGLPKKFQTPRNALTTTAYFAGCISDVTMNGQIVNFANSTDRKSAVLDNCARDILDYDVSAVPIIYPDDSVEPIVQLNAISAYDSQGGRDSYDDEDNNGDLGRDKDELPEVFTKRNNFDEILRKEAEEHQLREKERKAEEERYWKQQEAEAERLAEMEREQREREQRERLAEEEQKRKEEAERIKQEEAKKLDRLNELDNDDDDEELSVTVAPKPPTPRPTKKRPPPEKLEPICKLSVEPDDDTDFDAGYRFGTSSDSRIEYSTVPTKMRKTYDISLQFKTTGSDGVLFYAADDRHTGFVALYMQNGKIYHSFNSGNSSAVMISKNEYNNNEWHTVVITRQHAKGKLLINGEDEQFGEADGATRPIAIQAPFSFGGVNPNSVEDVYLNLKMNKGKVFTGCIRNIQIGGRSLGERSQTVGVLPCSEQIEDGVFFAKGGGYIKLRERFKVGTEMTIQFDMKPRTMNSLLLSVHGRKSFMILQLINGTIHFSVDNGDGPIVAVFKPEHNENFCDGEWRTVTATKSQYVITISVNSVSSEPSIGSALNPSTDTHRPLFFGGHPHLSKLRGIIMRKPYLGCMRNFKIKNVAEKILPSMTTGNVQTGVCWLN